MNRKTFFAIMIVLLLILSAGNVLAFAAPPAQSGGNIQFEAGQSTAWINGHVSARSKVKYNFYAMSGQVVSISLKSVQNTAYFGLSDDQGTEYLRLEPQYKYFTLPLRRTGTFTITVYDDQNGTDFSLNLTIPPLTQPAGVQTHVQNGGTIQIQPGQSTAWVSGTVQAYGNVQYQFYAERNQVLSLALKSTNGQAVFGLVDSKGNTYLDKAKKWSYYISPLYQTGPYNLTVYNDGAQPTNFNFQLTIPPLSQPAAVSQQPVYPPPAIIQPTPIPTAPPAPAQQRAVFQNGGAIQFGAGETSIWIAGNAAANSCNKYNFYAGNNYPLIVLLGSSSGMVNLGLADATGTTYLNNASNYTYWTMPLAKTTTYYLNVCNIGGQPSDYSFNLVIPARINFAPGATGATKAGSVKGNGVISYALYASAGQLMTVSLSGSATPQAFLRITGMADGQVYLDNNSFQTYWAATLPATQDYLIDVVAYGNPSSYQLNVSVK